MSVSTLPERKVSRIVFAVLLGIFLHATPALAVNTDNAIEECYHLAADPFDPQRVKSDQTRDVSPQEVFDICRAAIMEAPNDPRVNYNLAVMRFRVSIANGTHDEVYESLKTAVEQGYSAAKFWFARSRSVTGKNDFPEFSNQDLVEQAANEGYSPASYALFKSSENPDEKTAWLEKAVAQGNPYAKYSMAERYWHGTGVEQDRKEALRLYHEAAEGEDHRAAFALFQAYSGELDWDEIETNEVRAIEWLQEAARARNANALYRLGVIYRDAGDGLSQSKIMAMAHFIAAARLGNEEAALAVEQFENKLNKLERSIAGYEANRLD